MGCVRVGVCSHRVRCRKHCQGWGRRRKPLEHGEEYWWLSAELIGSKAGVTRDCQGCGERGLHSPAESLWPLLSSLEVLGSLLSPSSHAAWLLPGPAWYPGLGDATRQKQRPRCSFRVRCRLGSGGPSSFLSISSGGRFGMCNTVQSPSLPSVLSWPAALACG